ncbi:hypothetical protein Mar181_1347 [Marinomonas posidonica IVIA-Po-181]|uniref:Uncharacterized protein n=1 Tax=Marinomonas posidonica (strain CECT 7376 / NCIMB 14433 / IVIA-Po-181) TaxID=491952 RepID=F6CWP0_MARPP|nr:hypothetical protein Mar181_1347 [Marinomonas posidonica IVIA-Po-181]
MKDDLSPHPRKRIQIHPQKNVAWTRLYAGGLSE